MIQRLESQQGLPWHLTKANCEMVVRWAVEDKAESKQLTIGLIVTLFFAAAFVSSKRGG